MGSSSETKEQTVASEKYQPALNDYYNERFKRLIERMSHNLPINRTAIIKRELEQIDVDNSDDQLESLKYASALSVLFRNFHQNQLKIRHRNQLVQNLVLILLLH